MKYDSHHPFQSYLWNSLKKLQGWNVNEIDNNFYLSRKIKYFGVIYLCNFLDSSVIEKLIIEKVTNKTNFIFIYQPINSKLEEKKSILISETNFNLNYNQTYILKLQDTTNFLAKYHPKLRNQIKKCIKDSKFTWEINNANCIDDFIFLYYIRMKEEMQSSWDVDILKKLFDNLGNGVDLYSLRSNDSGIYTNYLMCISTNTVSMYLFGLTRKDLSPQGGAGVLFNLAFQHQKDLGRNAFDFGGVQYPPPNTRLDDINRFKKRFGGTYVEYPKTQLIIKKGSLSGFLIMIALKIVLFIRYY